jgi:hypothetical protein
VASLRGGSRTAPPATGLPVRRTGPKDVEGHSPLESGTSTGRTGSCPSSALIDCLTPDRLYAAPANRRGRVEAGWSSRSEGGPGPFSPSPTRASPSLQGPLPPPRRSRSRDLGEQRPRPQGILSCESPERRHRNVASDARSAALLSFLHLHGALASRLGRRHPPSALDLGSGSLRARLRSWPSASSRRAPGISRSRGRRPSWCFQAFRDSPHRAVPRGVGLGFASPNPDPSRWGQVGCVA